jgi:hypothetical protein
MGERTYRFCHFLPACPRPHRKVTERAVHACIPNSPRPSWSAAQVGPGSDVLWRLGRGPGPLPLPPALAKVQAALRAPLPALRAAGRVAAKALAALPPGADGEARLWPKVWPDKVRPDQLCELGNLWLQCTGCGFRRFDLGLVSAR